MQFIQTLLDGFVHSLLLAWYGVLSFVPELVIAIIFFAIGWVLAALVEKLVESLFKALKVDAALKSAGLEDVIKRAGHNLNSGLFVGTLVKWFIIVVFLMASFGFLGLDQANVFLGEVANYIPQVIVAVLILMVAVVVASALQKVVVASAKAGHIKSAELLGRVTKWSIWIFALVTALITLGIAAWIMQALLTAILAGGALAFGLAFGLGGKDVAARLLERTSHAVLEKE